MVNYKGNTPETAGKGASFIYSLNGETEGGNTEIDYENAPEKTVAEFLGFAHVVPPCQSALQRITTRLPPVRVIR